ncbi:MAG: HAMP domain-containing histidine kinase [Ignavibacteria bacterium]|nr:HAMP domain-containing histidine kinase [Ignavibacteria bacterium]
MATEYLPAERYPLNILKEQKSLIIKDEIFREIIEKIPYPILILNSLRQVVYYNDALLQNFPGLIDEEPFGHRPGEIFKCKHSYENEGCGTTVFCKTCGAARAIASSLEGREDIQECRILTIQDEAFDFRVWTYPKEINGERFLIFTLIDITHEKRREMLERIFYHDILNKASGIKGFLQLYFSEKDTQDELIKTALNFTDILIDEINSQRIISYAETGTLEITVEGFELHNLIEEIIQLYKNQFNFKSINLVIEVDEKLFLFTDKTILRRVVINLIKNAIEASNSNSMIKVTASKSENITILKVYNEQVMPEEVKLQIFKRSFSTKGKGRGLGTYSIKLLTEKFLNGKVDFVSVEGFGTEFIISVPDLNSSGQ